jgi:hypothetical protein
VFNEIASSPTILPSVWVKPAQDFLQAYQTPAELYRACGLVNIQVTYYNKYSDPIGGDESVPVKLCDYAAALSATVATAFAASPLAQITDNLKSAGVSISSEGWYDFDGDDTYEVWFTVIQPGETKAELWIAAEYSQGVKALFVDRLPGQNLHFKSVKNDSQEILTDFGFDKTIELVRHPTTGEPFVVVREWERQGDETLKQNLIKFRKLRQLLYQGGAAGPIYEQLLEIKGKPDLCPFEKKEERGSIISYYDCASFYYTLAFAAELVGKEDRAIEHYYAVWRMFPESSFAVMARLKLEQ